MENLTQIKLISNGGSLLCTFYNNGRANVMIIDDVYVIPENRHKGIASLLIKTALSIAKDRNVDSIELVCNESTSSFYEKLGFNKTNKYHYRIILNERPNSIDAYPKQSPRKMG